ncbi:mandelate racemase/muconate lactonizing enzyme family protein [Streptomyces sp. NBC_00654]|uniref:mandelate racemase/muconate lactonizing enzyme family protein n=1 Tax=Streptomyces sp. NBC_00654 TaxID=2975799 RepID=UPI00225B7516|nr:mandelate racemase/muconate lactonizing enzyme family protein [Streptomyces sp. NBC_00654]MCX4967539.1 mandelate racemase/muconate lactonizing enzyme family protein [Streptomyces sp. NBC_00654]
MPEPASAHLAALADSGVRVAAVRPVLLSAPYADPENLEVRVALPTGWRTTGLVEVTLDDGTTGLGEGYLAVFAPHVFVSTVDLLAPYLLGRPAADLAERYRDMVLVTGYWSLQGAARHVISAVEAALVDALGKRAGVPAYELLGGRRTDRIRLYASGGDSTSPAAMRSEIAAVAALGISTFKIRARGHEADKAVWTLDHAAPHGVGIAVDMAQNLDDPGQSVADALAFLDAVKAGTQQPLRFLEEPLGPALAHEYPALRRAAGCPVAGGETVTTARELLGRMASGYYDMVQPDATVVGGLRQTLAVFAAAEEHGVDTVVHCWGSAVCQAANYHAAFVGGGRLAEWPLPAYSLRSELLVEPFRIEAGHLLAPQAPGLGVRLTPETERRYAFRGDAVYRCLATLPPPVPGRWRAD